MMNVTKRNRILQVVLVLLCFVFYGNTLVNQYALDDAIVITDNTFVQKGIAGLEDIFTHDSFTGFFGIDKNLVAGGRYRPLSIALFAVEHAIWGNNPFVGHLINILLFACTCLLLFSIFRKLFTSFTSELTIIPVSFIASLLFLVHPIHTEVVANIKGLDEILSLLLSLVAWWFILRWSDSAKVLDRFMFLTAAGITLFLALLSKENAITFLAIIPASLWCFGRWSLRNAVFALIPLLLASLLFLKIRFSVLGYGASGGQIDELMNNPFVGVTTSQKFATIVYTLGIYIKLLLWPHPLTYDYYPYHIPIVEWSDPYVIISLLLYLSLAAFMIVLLLKKHIVGFALLLFFAALSIVSNIFFPIGTFMNERFMYMPSVGFAILVAWFFVEYLPTLFTKAKILKTLVISFGAILLLLALVKTASRNRAWYDDITLFVTDVKVSYNSAKSTCSAGGKLYETAKEEKDSLRRKQLLTESIMYLRRSVEIYPNYNDALLLLGNALFEEKKYDSTVYYYKRILEKAPFFDKVYENMPIVLNNIQSVDYKIDVWQYMYSKNPNNYVVCYQLGVLWGRYKNDLPKSLVYLERALSLNSRAIEVLKDLGVAYGMSGKYAEALAVLQRAEVLQPNDAQVLSNIAITYQNLGNTPMAQKYAQRAQHPQ